MMKLAFVLASVYAAVAIAAFIAQRRLMYFPDSARVAPSNYGLVGVEERVLDTPISEAAIVPGEREAVITGRGSVSGSGSGRRREGPGAGTRS